MEHNVFITLIVKHIKSSTTSIIHKRWKLQKLNSTALERSSSYYILKLQLMSLSFSYDKIVTKYRKLNMRTLAFLTIRTTSIYLTT